MFRARLASSIFYQEGLPAYWGIETNHQILQENLHSHNQEGLPAYWGIETSCNIILFGITPPIRKDYPLIGVLKQLG